MIMAPKYQTMLKKQMFSSDQVRLGYLKKSMEKIDTDDLSSAPEDSLIFKNDLVYVKETPNYIVFTEGWNINCKEAFEQKYGSSSADTIREKMPKRFEMIAKSAGLKLESFKYSEETFWDEPDINDIIGISVAIFKK